jgi:hypothetical protein
MIHTASMPLMIVKAGVPFVNLHQVGTDAAGAQIPRSSAKAPIGDFRSANEITIGHGHLSGQDRPDRIRPGSERRTAAASPQPRFILSLRSDASDTICRRLFSRERFSTTDGAYQGDATDFSFMSHLISSNVVSG